MNRNYGIWYVIIAILVIGAATTNYTNKLVKSQQAQVTVTTASTSEAVTLSGLNKEQKDMESPSEETAAARIAAAAPMPNEAAAETETETVKSPAETIISPAETRAEQRTEAAIRAAANETVPEAKAFTLIEETEEAASADMAGSGTKNYESRLAELDVQIKRLRDEETDSNTNSIRATAKTELKLWDGELNLIYNSIIEELNEDEKTKLIQEEREWMKERDALAVAAAKKSGGGTMEGLEYIASLAESTRKRVYELAASYKDVLDN